MALAVNNGSVFKMLLGLCFLLLVVPSEAFSSPQFITQWGQEGIGPGEFGIAVGIAVDDSFNVYVVDESNHRVEKFTRSGAFIKQWGTQGGLPGQFQFPNYVAADHLGNVYVSDTGNDRIQKFTSSGVFLSEWGSTGDGDGQFGVPLGIAVDNGGTVYVVDGEDAVQPPFGNTRIQRFTGAGVFLGKWGSLATLQAPDGIAVGGSDNRVYVTDRGHHEVWKYTTDGTLLATWGGLGTTLGRLQDPVGIAVDVHDGDRVYVAEFNNHRVQEFTALGASLDAWGSFGVSPGQFEGPQGLALDADGFIYVVDSVNHRIEKFLRTSRLGVSSEAPDESSMIVSPNPCRGEAVIQFAIGRTGSVRLDVLDVSGRMIAHVFDGVLTPGPYAMKWPSRDALGNRVPAGLYFVRELSAAASKVTRLLILD